MSEVANVPAAPATASVPASNSATAAKLVSDVSNPAIAPAVPPAPADRGPDKELERRAANLARAKREAAKNQAEREKLSQERATFSEKLKKADELERLAALQKSDPLAFVKEIGLNVDDLSRRYIEDATGSQKTPAELARTEANKVIEEYKKSLEAQRAKEQAENLKKRDEQIYAGVKQTMAELIQKDATRYEMLSDMPEEAVSRAFNLVVKFHNQNMGKEGYAPLAFDKALDVVETDEVEKAAKRAKSAKLAARLAADVPKAAAPAVAVKPSRDVAGSNVETTEKSPSPPQRKRRGMLDVRKMADELVAARKASLDS